MSVRTIQYSLFMSSIFSFKLNYHNQALQVVQYTILSSLYSHCNTSISYTHVGVVHPCNSSLLHPLICLASQPILSIRCFLPVRSLAHCALVALVHLVLLSLSLRYALLCSRSSPQLARSQLLHWRSRLGRDCTNLSRSYTSWSTYELRVHEEFAYWNLVFNARLN